MPQPGEDHERRTDRVQVGVRDGDAVADGGGDLLLPVPQGLLDGAGVAGPHLAGGDGGVDGGAQHGPQVPRLQVRQHAGFGEGGPQALHGRGRWRGERRVRTACRRAAREV